MTDREIMNNVDNYDDIFASDEELLIKNTTREEREELVYTAFALAVSDGSDWKPTGKGKELFQKYIDGEMELPEVYEEIIKMFRE